MATPDTAGAVSSPEKSTNGHAYSLPIPGVVRLSYALASRINTRFASDLARRIFFMPPHQSYLDTQRAILLQAGRITLDVMGRKVAAYSWGNGPLVLLMHGWGGHAGHMTELVEPLTRTGYRVVATDAPAHGRSQGRLSSVLHFAAAIEAAADACGPVHGIVAHSLGTAGATYALHGGLGVNRVAFIAPMASFTGYWRLFRHSLGMPDADWQTMVAISEKWLGLRFADVHPATHAPAMTAPLLVLHGSRDRMIASTEGRDLARLWPGAVFRELDAGHLSILRDTRALDAITAFMHGHHTATPA